MADLEVGKTYPILVDGDPAPSGHDWTSTQGGVVSIEMGGPGDTLVVAVVIGVGTTDLGVTIGGRSGTVTVNATAAPLEITFGDPL